MTGVKEVATCRGVGNHLSDLSDGLFIGGSQTIVG